MTKQKVPMAMMAIKLEGGGGEREALMAWPLAGKLFCGFPYRLYKNLVVGFLGNMYPL